MNFVYDPVQAAQLTAYVQYISPVKGVREELIKMGGDAAALADSPILFPTPRTPPGSTSSPTCPPTIDDADHRALPRGSRAADDGRRATPVPTAACARGRRVPYVLLIPGMLFTFVFFVVPLITLLKISLSTKPDRLLPNYEFTWEWSNFGTAFDDFGEQLLRSFVYAGIATVLCLLIAYPIAYFIAFKAGRWRNVLLGLVMVPFFTSFLLRTIAWQSLLNDSGPVLGVIDGLQPRRHPRPRSASSTTGGCSTRRSPSSAG